jgi:hypothetical protein
MSSPSLNETPEHTIDMCRRDIHNYWQRWSDPTDTWWPNNFNLQDRGPNSWAIKRFQSVLLPELQCTVCGKRKPINESES